jgi:uncharacterized iron-regulated membrane protein
VARRPPRDARVLGLWTAGWLALLLLIGLAWVGNWRVEWPVLLVPVVWALVALSRGRGRGRRDE